MNMKKKANLLVMLVILLLVASGTGAQAANVSIRLNKSAVTLAQSKTTKLKATVKGSGKKVKWSSSNKKVAVVSRKGKVTAKKAGSAVITAKTGKAKATCRVTVTQNYQELYAAYLTKHKAKTSTHFADASYSMKNKKYVNEFFLYDVDKDGIPELFTFTTVNFRWHIVRILTCSGNKVIPYRFSDGSKAEFDNNAAANGGYSFHICSKGHIHNIWSGSMGMTAIRVYTAEGGRLQRVSSNPDCAYKKVIGYANTDAVRKKLKKNTCKVTK